MSSPPGNCTQLAALKPANAQVTGITEITLGVMPGAPRIRAAMLPGRAAITADRNCGVSTNALMVSELLLRSPSYEKKKKARSFQLCVLGPPSPNLGRVIGPPMLPPN